MGPFGDVKLFDDIARPAKNLLGQGYNFVTSRLAKKVRNNSIEA
jgi:hypothetical protein